MKISNPHFWEQYVQFLSKRRYVVSGCILLLTIGSTFFASKLQLRSSLKELLPQNAPSVKALDHVIENVGGVGNLIIAVESPQPKANQRYMDDLRISLSKVITKDIRYIEYSNEEREEFFKKHALLYFDVQNLKQLSTDAKEQLEYEKIRKLPVYIDLEEDRQKSFNLDKYRNKISRQIPKPSIDTYKGYFGSPDGTLFFMILRARGTNMSIPFAKAMIEKVNNTVQQLNPKTYHPEMEIGLTGSFPSAVEEYNVVRNDIFSTALLCVALVALIILLFLRKIKPLLFFSITLLTALSWTFSVTEIFIGYLNSQTAFLGAIILGTGINYGVILWGRYAEERKKGNSSHHSLVVATAETAMPTFLAAATTATAFAVLWISDVRSLSQFGFIGSMGVIFCWISTLVLLPLSILFSENSSAAVAIDLSSRRQFWLVNGLTFLATKGRFAVLGVLLFLLGLSGFVIFHHKPNAIEYDFSKLQNKKSGVTGSDYWVKKVGKHMARSTVPTIAHLSTSKKAQEYCQAVRQRVSNQLKRDRLVDECRTIFDLVPKHQAQKLSYISDLGRILNEPWISKLDRKTIEDVKEAKQFIIDKEIAAIDLPKSLALHFADIRGDVGNIALISPVKRKWLSDGRHLLKYAQSLKNIELPDGEIVNAAGESLVFSDVVEIIKKETSFLILASFCCVLFVTFLLVRSIHPILLVTFGLSSGIVLMMSVAAFMNMKINFFNFMVIPLTIGVAVDYALNISLRLTRDHKHSLSHILQHTGKSIALCSATTFVSYFVLTQANNQALVSFGKAAMIGEVTCLLAALLFVPSLFTIFESHSAAAQPTKVEPEKLTQRLG